MRTSFARGREGQTTSSLTRGMPLVKYLITLQPWLLICKMESYHLIYVAILDAKENICEGPSITVLMTIAISEEVYFP